ncbi:hypothetical protein MP638_003779 [Amoeboaphelidium occidentale]|nr:hypothetical protein MP638_003779 [Amoeboaphelidium occidentale]
MLFQAVWYLLALSLMSAIAASVGEYTEIPTFRKTPIEIERTPNGWSYTVETDRDDVLLKLEAQNTSEIMQINGMTLAKKNSEYFITADSKLVYGSIRAHNYYSFSIVSSGSFRVYAGEKTAIASGIQAMPHVQFVYSVNGLEGRISVTGVPYIAAGEIVWMFQPETEIENCSPACTENTQKGQVSFELKNVRRSIDLTFNFKQNSFAQVINPKIQYSDIVPPTKFDKEILIYPENIEQHVE